MKVRVFRQKLVGISFLYSARHLERSEAMKVMSNEVLVEEVPTLDKFGKHRKNKELYN